ncbi:MAG: hypothetical protein GEU95_13840 [Rhizobiales bacterium]|nr:hypothetical protein [Hyphomicrobiales bacterium]
MVKSLTGIAAAAILAVVTLPSVPANAAAIRHVSGIAEHQSNVETVQYRRYHRRYHRRHWRGPRWRGHYGPRRFYGGGPYYYGGYPYAYAPYPYYRRYYRPRPFIGIGIGPVGIGVW